MNAAPTHRPPANDWVSRPLSAFLLWCVPLALGFGTNVLRMPVRTQAVVWAVAFAWMGAGCALNALRCHRLHCYISAPVFLAGAIASGLFAANLLAVGHFGTVVSATLGLVALSFVLEFVWRKYA